MANREFKKEWLQELLWRDGDEGEVVLDEIVDNRRWSIVHCMVFFFEGMYYETSYSRGATEHQDEQPFEYEDDDIECTEVEPVEVVKIEYKPVKD